MRAALWPYLTLVAARLLLGASGTYPVVHPDEVIYRELARGFAGVGPTPDLSGTFLFPNGYPLLIAPLFYFFDTFQGLGFAILLFNALLGAALYFPVRAFLLRLGAEPQPALIAALLTGLYPAYVASAGMAVTEHAFVTLFATLVLCAWRLYESPSLGRAALLGAVSVLLYAVHERALLMLALLALQLPLLALVRRLRWRQAAAALAVLAGGFLGVRALFGYSAEALYRGGAVQRPLGEVMIAKLLSLEGWRDILIQSAGQLWYLQMATAGLFGLGVGWILARVWRARGSLLSDGPETSMSHALLLFALASAAIFGTCAVYLPENPIMAQKAEYLFFGRINEGFLPLALAAGVIALPRAGWRGMLASLLLTLAFGAATLAGRGLEQMSDAPGAWGVFGLRWMLRGEWLVHPLTGTALLTGIAFVASRSRRAFLALLACGFVWTSLDLSRHYLGRRLQREYRRSLPELARSMGIETVAVERHRVRTGRYADWIRRTEFRGFAGRPPPAEAVLSDRRFGGRFLLGERDARYALWAAEREALYQPPDPRTVIYGAQAIWSVEESGFREHQQWAGARPARWTGRRARLGIPLLERQPTRIRLRILEAAPETRLEVRAQGETLLEAVVGPEPLTLEAALPAVRERLDLELLSDTQRRWVSIHGDRRRVSLGVLLGGVVLLEGEPQASDPSPRGTLEARWQHPGVLALRVRNTGTGAWTGEGPRIEAEGLTVPLGRPVAAGGELRLLLRTEARRLSLGTLAQTELGPPPEPPWRFTPLAGLWDLPSPAARVVLMPPPKE